MNKLIRCAFCDEVIKIIELKKADAWGDHFCKKCETFLNEFIEQYRREKPCQ